MDKQLLLPRKESQIVLYYLFKNELEAFFDSIGIKHETSLNDDILRAESLVKFLDPAVIELYRTACQQSIKTLCMIEPKLTLRSNGITDLVLRPDSDDIIIERFDGDFDFITKTYTCMPAYAFRFKYFSKNYLLLNNFCSVRSGFSDDYKEMMTSVQQFLYHHEGDSWSSIEPNFRQDLIHKIEVALNCQLNYLCNRHIDDPKFNLLHYLGLNDRYDLLVLPYEKKLTLTAMNFDGNLPESIGPTLRATMPTQIDRPKNSDGKQRDVPIMAYRFDNNCEIQVRTHIALDRITPGSIASSVKLTKLPAGTFQCIRTWI